MTLGGSRRRTALGQGTLNLENLTADALSISALGGPVLVECSIGVSAAFHHARIFTGHRQRRCHGHGNGQRHDAYGILE